MQVSVRLGMKIELPIKKSLFFSALINYNVAWVMVEFKFIKVRGMSKLRAQKRHIIGITVFPLDE